MKVIKYKTATKANRGTSEKPEYVTIMSNVKMEWNEVNEEIAKREAWGGEYEIVDDGQPDPADIPTQLDRIEAQATYTAMLTDTLLPEV